LYLCHVGATVIDSTISTYPNANVSCDAGDVAPGAFVDDGYVVVDDALNGGSKMRNARLPFCAGAHALRLATLLPSFWLKMCIGCVHVITKLNF